MRSTYRTARPLPPMDSASTGPPPPLAFPKIPDVRSYGWGSIEDFENWKMQLDNKLTVDRAIYPTNNYRIRYAFSRFEGTSMKVVSRLLGQFSNKTDEDRFTSMTLEELLRQLQFAHLRRERKPFGKKGVRIPPGLTLNEHFDKAIAEIKTKCSDETVAKDMLVDAMRSHGSVIHADGMELMEEEPYLEFQKFVDEYRRSCLAWYSFNRIEDTRNIIGTPD